MSLRVLNCGYVPLVDSAALILAEEMGFAAQEGLSLNLLQQPSWAALRDLLALGHLDAAHMLSPMPSAMSLGLSGSAVDVVAPLVISANGTVLGVAKPIAIELALHGWERGSADPVAFLKHLGQIDRKLRVAVPFPFSMHHLLFRYLVHSGPQKSLSDFEIVTMPPPLMAQAAAAGEIDLFFVGEPWGSVAVGEGAAELALPGALIWAHAPEKVLGMRRAWVDENDDLAGALVRAVYRACAWLGERENRSLAGEILARTQHLNLPDDAIDPALTGLIRPNTQSEPWQIANFLRFHKSATTFPWRSFGAWVGDQLGEMSGLDAHKAAKVAASTMRPDLYRRYLGGTSADMPGASAKIEGFLAHPTPVASMRGEMILGPDAFFDGKTFDFTEIF